MRYRALDPPLKGRFESAGTFYADDTIQCRPIRVRYHLVADHADERALGAGVLARRRQEWETNWISDFRRRKAQ